MIELRTSAHLKNTQDIINKTQNINSAIKNLSQKINEKLDETKNEYRKVKGGLFSTQLPDKESENTVMRYDISELTQKAKEMIKEDAGGMYRKLGSTYERDQ